MLERLKAKIEERNRINHAIRLMYWQAVVDLYSDLSVSEWDFLRVQREYIEVSSSLGD